MQAEFYKDDLGYIWFFYAKDIFVRRPPELPPKDGKESKADKIKERVKEMVTNKEKVRKNMIQELEQYEA